MDLPDIYDLTYFDKKTHNIIINVIYDKNTELIRMIHDGKTIFEDKIRYDKSSYSYYNLYNCKLIKHLIRIKKMRGWCLSSDGFYRELPTDSSVGCSILLKHIGDIYISHSNLSSFTYIYIYRVYNGEFKPFTGTLCANALIILSNNIIEPIFYFDIKKMTNVGRYVHQLSNMISLVYTIYKYYDMYVIYNSHIIENGEIIPFMNWRDDILCCDLNAIGPDTYDKSKHINASINFKLLFGDFNMLVYEFFLP